MSAAQSKSRATGPRKGKLRFPVTGGNVHERDGMFHIAATVRLDNRSIRVRQSLFIPADRQNIQAAVIKAENCLTEARLELGGAARLSFAENAATYLKRGVGDELGFTDVAAIKELTGHFATRQLWTIPASEIVAFVDDRQAGNAASTRERYISTVVAFLNNAVARGQYPALPQFNRDQKARNPTTRQRRAVEKVTPVVIQALLHAMHLTTRTQIAFQIETGGRVRSVLHGCSLGDLDLGRGRMTIKYNNTKAGFDVSAALPETIRPLLTEYLSWRENQVLAGRIGPGSHEPLFLSPRGKPYKDNGARWGTQNKTAFNGAKRRAGVQLRLNFEAAIAVAVTAGDDAEVALLRRSCADDLRVVSKITQHWFRHKLATELGRRDLRAAMMQGGWKDIRTVQGYLMHDAEYQRLLVEQRGFRDTNLTRREADDDIK